MENVTKALYIASAVLLAVMLMVGITYVISSMSEVQRQDIVIEKAQQAAKFNAEYDVFKKSLMYGTDIISILNKATSNNEKYVLAGGMLDTYLNGDKYEEEFLINITIKFKTTDELAGNVRVYAINSRGKTLEVLGPSVGKSMKDVFKCGEAGSLISDLYNVVPTSDIAADENSDIELVNQVIPANGEFQLYKYTNGIYEASKLMTLIREESKKLDVTVSAKSVDSTIDPTNWKFATFSTATKALKSKKFKFVSATYCEDEGNSAYGRITSMSFEEV